jgi:ribonuclease HII
MARKNLEDLLAYERELFHQGYRYIAGIDEAGRGPLAGPVVAACVLIDMEAFSPIEGVYDSKALTSRQRSLLYEKICESVCWGVGIVSNETIDALNIYRATQEAMKQALANCSFTPDIVLTDAMPLSIPSEIKSIIKGDQKSYAIASASIIAKVTRDKIMDELHREYPHYGWNTNRGYPTEKHRAAIRQYGLSPYHRRSFDCYGQDNQDTCQ